MSSLDQNCVDLEFIELSRWVGADPLLIQAGGGNTSYKAQDYVYVKASGCTLDQLDASKIAKVSFKEVNEKLANLDEKITAENDLVPSIETPFHALMNYKYVFHLHSVDAIVYSLYENWKELLLEKFSSKDPAYNIEFIDYYRPGLPLALAIRDRLQANPKANLIFLRNHGVVLGANTINEMKAQILDLKATLKLEEISESSAVSAVGASNVVTRDLKEFAITTFMKQLALTLNIIGFNYSYAPELGFNNLALSNIANFAKVGPFYPDHVVYLGEKVLVISDLVSNIQEKQIFEKFEQKGSNASNEQEIALGLVTTAETIAQALPKLVEAIKAKETPKFIIIENFGVLFNFTKNAEKIMLSTFYEVCRRIEPNKEISHLTESELYELTHWDAEKYRQSISK